MSDTLANRLNGHEREKIETLSDIEWLPAQFRYHPDMVKNIVAEVRTLAETLESIGSDSRATLEDIEGVRGNLRDLLGTITLKPHDGVLWAHPNAKGPTEVRPLEGPRINSPKSGSGGRI